MEGSNQPALAPQIFVLEELDLPALFLEMIALEGLPVLVPDSFGLQDSLLPALTPNMSVSEGCALPPSTLDFSVLMSFGLLSLVQFLDLELEQLGIAQQMHNIDISRFHPLEHKLVPLSRAKTQGANLSSNPTILVQCKTHLDPTMIDLLATHICQSPTPESTQNWQCSSFLTWKIHRKDKDRSLNCLTIGQITDPTQPLLSHTFSPHNFISTFLTVHHVRVCMSDT